VIRHRFAAVAALTLLCVTSTGVRAPAQQADAIMTALETELTRSMEGLAAAIERGPYFIGFTVWDRRDDVITAGAGSILVDRAIRQRLLDVDLRVGDHSLDNTRMLQGRGAPPPMPRGATVLPIDDDVGALRADIWQRVDRQQRIATARLAQVQASMAGMPPPVDSAGDFSPIEPAVRIEPATPPPPLDRGVWLDRLRRVSARFNDHPSIHNAVLQLMTRRDVKYVVASDGTRVRVPEGSVRARRSKT
jgi:hypothetical protein